MMTGAEEEPAFGSTLKYFGHEPATMLGTASSMAISRGARYFAVASGGLGG
jgi:hypothetical protein